MTHIEAFRKMLDHAGVGYGLRHDHSGSTAVLVEMGESLSEDGPVSEWLFGEDGMLLSNLICA
jgi:hypothetical protein